MRNDSRLHQWAQTLSVVLGVAAIFWVGGRKDAQLDQVVTGLKETNEVVKDLAHVTGNNAIGIASLSAQIEALQGQLKSHESKRTNQ